MTPPPEPGGNPGKYEERVAQWFLEHCFFRDFVCRNPASKGSKGELAEAVVLFGDVAVLLQVKAKFSKRSTAVWAPKQIEKALSQLRHTYRMLVDGHVPTLHSETFGEIVFDPQRYRSCVGLIVLACDPDEPPGAAIDGFLNDGSLPVHFFSLKDLALTIERFDTAADLIVYLELRQLTEGAVRPRLHAEAETIAAVSEHARSVMFAGSADDAGTEERTMRVFRAMASGQLRASDEYRYGLAIDDIIAHLHDQDPELGGERASAMHVAEILAWLNRYRRIEIGRRLLQSASDARDGQPRWFAWCQRRREVAYAFFVSDLSRPDRRSLVLALALGAKLRHGVRVGVGVATEPIGPGRSYDVAHHEGTLTPELMEVAERGRAFFGKSELHDPS